MTNNDILRRLRYTFHYSDKKMVALFALADYEVSREQVVSWLKKEDDDGYVNCNDQQLAAFLNGLINEKRGKKSGEQPKSEKKLTNNIILMKLKIAFALKAEDVIDLLKLVDLRISKPELSAFFRKPDHKHYRQCKDQILRNFLQAIQEKYYVERSKKIDFTNAAPSASNVPKTKKNKKNSHKKATAKTLYVNPNAKPSTSKGNKAEPKPQRKVLKLKPEDIYKQD